MAFGKKKTKDEEHLIEAAVHVTPEAEAGEAIGSELFAAPSAAAEVEVPEAADDTPVDDASQAEAPAEAPAGDPLGGADLLSMFQTTTVESDDRAAILELAGEVEIDDLLEDLQTVAVALGIKP